MTKEEAQAYFDTRLRTDAWDYATDTDKDKALAMATRAIGRLSKRKDDDGVEILPTDDLNQATCEEALALLLGDPDITDLHVVSQTTVGINTTVDVNVDRPWVAAGLASPVAWQILAPYLLDPRNLTIERV